MTKRSKNIWRKYLNVLIVVLIFYFLGTKFIKDVSKTGSIEWRIDYLYLAFSIFCLVLGLLDLVQIWRLNLKAFGISRNFKDIFRIVNLANMGRYLPGKVWSVLGLVHLAKEVEIPQTTAVLCTIVNQTTSILAGFIVGGAFLIGFSDLSHKMHLWWIGVTILLILMSLHPYTYKMILKLVAKFTKKKIIETKLKCER